VAAAGWRSLVAAALLVSPFCVSAQAGAAPLAASAAGAPVAADGAALLAARALQRPIEGATGESLRDTFDSGRPGHRHEAIDIAAPRGTAVHAVDDGTLVKLFTSKPGGLTVYQFDPAGQLAYYYAHLERYAEGVHEGMALRRGDLLGYVGTTGNAAPDAPHLHFAVFRLGPQKQWWSGTAVNPYPELRKSRR